MTRLPSILFVCSLFPCYLTQLATVPELMEGETIIAVEVSENETSSTTVYCTSSNQVDWLVNGTLVHFDGSTGQGQGSFSYLKASNDDGLRSNLTVTSDFSDPATRFEIQCTGDNETATFVFGMRTAPRLKDPQSNYTVVEDDSFYINLKEATPFPPYDYPGLTLTWLLNDTLINDSRITLWDYSLSIDSVWRNLHWARFTLTANTSVSYVSKSFILVVNFPAEAQTIYNNTVVYQELGETAHLVAADGLAGRPSPSFQWYHPNGTEIHTVVDGSYTILSNGRSTIKSVKESDFGTYIYSASNGIGNELVVMVTLVKAVPPGKPLNVNVSMVMDEIAVVTWGPPTYIGAPPLTKYALQLNPSPDNQMLETNATYYKLTGLIPATTYTINITSMSDFDFSSGASETSDTVSFRTSFGIPRISGDSKAINTSDGQLSLLFALKHTGGYDPDTVEIEAACGPVQSFKLPTQSQSENFNTSLEEADFVEECLMSCFDDELKGQFNFDKVLVAGTQYICAISAQNIEGTFYYNTTKITAEIGIPKLPTFSVTINTGSITINVSPDFIGVPSSDPSFNFTVNVIDSNGITVFSKTYMYNATNMALVIELPIGNYTVQVYSQNKYGISDTATTQANVQMMGPSASPTIGIEDDKFPLEAIVGIAVGGTVLVFAVFITIVIIVICAVKVKGRRDSVSFYRAKYEMTIKRY